MSPRSGRRCVLGFLLASSLVVLAVTATVSWPHARVWVYEQRIRRGVNPQGNLAAIAELHSSAAAALLERWVSSPPPGLGQAQPLQLLLEHYPESSFAGGIKEYEAITRRSYLHSFYWSSLDYDDRYWLTTEVAPNAVPELRSWLARFPGHPGCDDASLRLAILLCEDDPISALRHLHQGFHEPDGDKRQHLANWFQCVLERCASAEQLLAWLDGDCPEHARENVIYAAAVKRLRERRFAEAHALFERWRGFAGAGCSELAGWWGVVSTSGDRREPIAAQIAACAWFREEEAAFERALDDEGKARILHRMGRRAFNAESDKTFHNHYYYPLLLDPRRGPYRVDPASGKPEPLAAADISASHHYRQAADIFQRLLRDYPGYSDIESVAYSAPLCLWRLVQTPLSRLEFLHREIAEGFQAFAARFPRSTMADEALYLAGIHHFLATGRADASVLRRNLDRIVEDHAGGNVLAEYITENDWLQAAVAARKFSGGHLPGAQRGVR